MLSPSSIQTTLSHCLLGLAILFSVFVLPILGETPTFNANSFFSYVDQSCSDRLDTINVAGDDMNALVKAAQDSFGGKNSWNWTPLREDTFVAYFVLTEPGDIDLSATLPKVQFNKLGLNMESGQYSLYCDGSAMSWVEVQQEGENQDRPFTDNRGPRWYIPPERHGPKVPSPFYIFGTYREDYCKTPQNQQIAGASTPKKNYIILCPAAFMYDYTALLNVKNTVQPNKKPLDDMTSTGAVMLHEFTHAILGTSAIDEIYGAENCVDIAQNGPEPLRVRKNADTFMFYAMASYLQQNAWVQGFAEDKDSYGHTTRRRRRRLLDVQLNALCPGNSTNATTNGTLDTASSSSGSSTTTGLFCNSTSTFGITSSTGPSSSTFSTITSSNSTANGSTTFSPVNSGAMSSSTTGTGTVSSNSTAIRSTTSSPINSWATSSSTTGTGTVSSNSTAVRSTTFSPINSGATSSSTTETGTVSSNSTAIRSTTFSPISSEATSSSTTGPGTVSSNSTAIGSHTSSSSGSVSATGTPYSSNSTASIPRNSSSTGSGYSSQSSSTLVPGNGVLPFPTMTSPSSSPSTVPFSFSGVWSETPTTSSVSFTWFDVPTSTISDSAATSEAVFLGDLFFALQANRQWLTDSKLKSQYLDDVRKAQDEALALFNDLNVKPPEIACSNTKRKRNALSERELRALLRDRSIILSIAGALGDAIGDVTKLVSCAVNVVKNLVDSVEADVPDIDEIENLTDTLAEIGKDLEDEDNDKSTSTQESSSSTSSSSSSPSSSSSCTGSTAVPICTQTVSFSTSYMFGSSTYTVATITQTTCSTTTIAGCTAAGTTASATAAASDTAAAIPTEAIFLVTSEAALPTESLAALMSVIDSELAAISIIYNGTTAAAATSTAPGAAVSTTGSSSATAAASSVVTSTPSPTTAFRPSSAAPTSSPPPSTTTPSIPSSTTTEPVVSSNPSALPTTLSIVSITPTGPIVSSNPSTLPSLPRFSTTDTMCPSPFGTLIVNEPKTGSGPCPTYSTAPPSSSTVPTSIATASNPDEPCLLGPECQTTPMQTTTATLSKPKITTTSPPGLVYCPEDPFGAGPPCVTGV